MREADAGAQDGWTERRLDDERVEFVVGQPVVANGPRVFTSCDEAREHPVAESILAVPGVAEVTLSGASVTVRRQPDRHWADLDEAVRYALTTALRRAATPGAATSGPLDDDAIYERVAALFSNEINPTVARHGGKVELIDVQDRTVLLRMQGGCQGCGMATVTLRQGIEAQLRRAVPSLAGVRDITDHSAGRNPYFQASTK